MGISSAGIGSGLDVNGLITQLMQLERQPLDSLNTKKQTFNNQLSAFGQVKSALDAFKTAIANLKLDMNFAATKASSSNTDLLTATTDNSNAVAGSYDIVVSALAQAGVQASAGQPSSSTAIGAANFDAGGPSMLHFATSGKSFDISIDATDTLETVRDKINNAVIPGDTTAQGLATASIVNAGTAASPSYKLVVASTQQGTDNNVNISTTDTKLNSYFGFSSTQTASNASFSVNGLPITRSTNSVTDVVAGVTLNLAAADPTKHVTLSVARDTDAVASKINDFITAYNKLSSTVTNLHQKGGTLEADNSATSVISQLQGVFNQPANITGGSYSWLAQIGVSFQKDGTLALDKDAFSKAMNTDFKGVVSLFTDTTSGFAGRLYTAASNMLDTNGLLDSRISGLNTRINSLDDNIDRENVRLTSVEARLRKQYASLDSLLGTMKNTSNYLAAQLK
ncbi:MAG TPA: flagellar filament capping protein FliD [Azospira sp.]|nr:flagellar filament capping protein FliD [Azospira sp.]